MGKRTPVPKQETRWERGKKRIGKFKRALLKASKKSGPFIKKASAWGARVSDRAEAFGGGGWGDLAPSTPRHHKRRRERGDSAAHHIYADFVGGEGRKPKRRRRRRGGGEETLTLL